MTIRQTSHPVADQIQLHCDHCGWVARINLPEFNSVAEIEAERERLKTTHHCQPRQQHLGGFDGDGRPVIIDTRTIGGRR